MSTSVATRFRTVAAPRDAADEDVYGELCAALFSAFPRRDQRIKAEQYLRGLLTAQGRKSIRNIAAQIGGPAAEQSLHHFISSSTWDWRPMRAELARFLQQNSGPQAWVVRPMPIPKAGDHSVGVDRRFDPERGQVFRGQQAFGVWMASEELSVPVNWRLFLPDPWVKDRTRRDRAEVPEGAAEETLEECAVNAALDTARWPEVTRKPLLLDIRGGAGRAALHRLAVAGVPVVARIGTGCRLTVADRSLPGFGAGPLTAQQILESLKGLRRPVSWVDSAAGVRTSRTSLATAVRVTLPVPAGERQRPLLLLGEWDDPRRAPARLWITDLTGSAVGPLLRLTKLSRRVERDFRAVGEGAGLRDFVGRSFRGWHRHITLASAAHAATVLAPGWNTAAAPTAFGQVQGRSAG
ncbi:IS701 family transposase [Streptomyces showdoensis]|uniref:Transposase n=1 Tax=Streptomyces showdoensis TaxID=68268 RepID=A0A2P2GRF0_STREW|nr:transposase [Streptomyces showdoensis]KKZ74087.1 transposase [Streptomyces showdoensis]